MKYMMIACILIVACTGYRERVKEKKTGHPDPLRHKVFYNPNNGYEAYWADGEWHFRDPGEWDFSNVTRTRVPTVCGDECPYLYTGVGPICTRIPGNHSYIQCKPYKDDYCGDYEEHMYIQNNYVTFKSYCAYLDAKCKAKMHKKPMMIYVGTCINDHYELYKPLSFAKYPVSRLVYYLDELNKIRTLKYVPSNYTTTTTRTRVKG